MNKLIEQLKEEHFKLIKILKGIQEFVIGTEESRKKLLVAKKVDLSSEKEDEELYPILKMLLINLKILDEN